MRKTVILGLLVLFVGLAIPAVSASEYYLIPDHTNGGEFCNNSTVEIWINATENIRSGKVTIDTDPTCGNIVACRCEPATWPITDCAVINPSKMRLMYAMFMGPDKPAGHYKVGEFDIHCNDSCNCTTDVAFNNTGGDDETYAANETHLIPVTWDDGIFTCGLDAPNLIVESVKLNPGYSSSYDDYYFANESNTVNITIKNIGTLAAGASETWVTGASGNSVAVAVGALAPGASQTVTVVDTGPRPVEEVVNAVADCNNAVTECNEDDNTYEISSDDLWHDFIGTVINHGLKGKRWTGGSDLTTWDTFNCNLVYSLGDSSYVAGNSHWTMIDVAWTAAELPIPDGAAITEARLYVPYTWDKEDAIPNGVTMSFNGVSPYPVDAHYLDRKGFANYDEPYGMLAYDVTGDFDSSGNYANFSKAVALDEVSIRGMILMVVYEGECGRERLIFVNEGFDNLYGRANYGTNLTEATAWAPLTGATIDMANLSSAKLITFAPGAGPTEGNLIFKNAAGETTWNDVWNFGGIHGAQIGIDERDVTALLTATGNEVGFQSDLDWMEASNVFLIVTYDGDAEECLGTCYDDASCTANGVPDMTCAACIAASKYWHPNLDANCFDGNTPADMCIGWCPECSDGVDNTDQDTFVDFPADPECTCGLDPSEDIPSCPIPELATFTLVGIGLMMFVGVVYRRKE